MNISITVMGIPNPKIIFAKGTNIFAIAATKNKPMMITIPSHELGKIRLPRPSENIARILVIGFNASMAVFFGTKLFVTLAIYKPPFRQRGYPYNLSEFYNLPVSGHSTSAVTFPGQLPTMKEIIMDTQL